MPNLIEAVNAMRSYDKTIEATSLDTSALASWIDRNANPNVQRQQQFTTDAAIGVLSYYGHPLFTNANMTQMQRDWAALMASAEQMLQQEVTWSNQQVSMANLTMFARLFGSDVSWLRNWANGQMPPDTGLDFIVNEMIDQLRTCQGQSGAGSYSHQTHSSISPVP
tara:strand:+ start:356 stop:853 length:498 start_codon:yes stop_codon:yes gene_type:complete